MCRYLVIWSEYRLLEEEVVRNTRYQLLIGSILGVEIREGDLGYFLDYIMWKFAEDFIFKCIFNIINQFSHLWRDKIFSSLMYPSLRMRRLETRWRRLARWSFMSGHHCVRVTAATHRGLIRCNWRHLYTTPSLATVFLSPLVSGTWHHPTRVCAVR